MGIGGAVGVSVQVAVASAIAAATARPVSLGPMDAPSALPVETTLAAWMDDARASTVRVEAGTTRGSGTLVSHQHVLTARHVVGEATDASVTLPDGRHVHARVVRTDAARDLALLALAEAEPAARCTPIAPHASPRGAWVVGAGVPGGLAHAPPVASVGVVLDRLHGDEGDLVLDLGIAPGMSGGPVLAASGALVGVIVRLDAAAPIEADDALLATARCDDAPHAHALPSEHDDPSASSASRDVALRAWAPPERASVAASEVSLAHGAVRTRGVAVGVDTVWTSVDPSVVTLHGCAGIEIVGHAEWACDDVVVRGELMQLRFSGARLTPLTTFAAAAPEAGALLGTADAAHWGVVDGARAAAGELVPFVPLPGPRHCGTLARMRRDAEPRVTLGDVIAHDVPSERGALLVDAHGLPTAIDVGHHVVGRGYAVPIAEARARFSR